MFYVTFLLVCQGKPDYPIFTRTRNFDGAIQAYHQLKTLEVHKFIDENKCHVYNVRIQYEEIRDVRKNHKRNRRSWNSST